MAARGIPAELIRAALEARLGHEVASIRPVAGGDINDAYRAETAAGPLFVKSSAAAGPRLFAQEAAGLLWLAGAGGLAVPQVVAVDPLFLALEWIEPGSLTPAAEEALGRGLAAVHAAGAPAFGATPQLGGAGALAPSLGHAPTRFGEITLPNTPRATFAEFYAANRVLPLAAASHARGALSADGLALMGRLAERLPELCGPAEPPARTHGDLWAGNVLTSRGGVPYLIDCAAHGGHREIDLAALRVFGGPGARCFDAYAEVAPLADGHEERVALFQLGIILLHVALFGGGYEAQALRIAQRYV